MHLLLWRLLLLWVLWCSYYSVCVWRGHIRVGFVEVVLGSMRCELVDMVQVGGILEIGGGRWRVWMLGRKLFWVWVLWWEGEIGKLLYHWGRTVVADMLGFGIKSLADTGSPGTVLCRATLGDAALVQEVQCKFVHTEWAPMFLHDIASEEVESGRVSLWRSPMFWLSCPLDLAPFPVPSRGLQTRGFQDEAFGQLKP
jgi:hypothetical protein